MLGTTAVVAAGTVRRGCWPVGRSDPGRDGLGDPPNQGPLSELVKRAQKQPQQLPSHGEPVVEAEELDL
ncbi:MULTISPECIES: hypothetical protein [unclassified Cyanobium]|uniref:hypothetical protein n=1 Tax=unclassified Cyanobium TaxID=2627006 RepID=UPI0020CC3B32|nr:MULTISPECIES: hypothetical protein [unclassified Cyanobium]MCP9832776.1 hypothetical protein [Cyanobium sp. La Preciosa 7G6]